jgi:hypothetical protein
MHEPGGSAERWTKQGREGKEERRKKRKRDRDEEKETKHLHVPAMPTRQMRRRFGWQGGQEGTRLQLPYATPCPLSDIPWRPCPARHSTAVDMQWGWTSLYHV